MRGRNNSDSLRCFSGFQRRVGSRCAGIPADGSRGIVNAQPTPAIAESPPFFSLARPSCHEGTCKREKKTEKPLFGFRCRLGLNDPPTAVGGIQNGRNNPKPK